MLKFVPRLETLGDRIVPTATPEYLLDGVPVPAEAVVFDTPTLQDVGLAPAPVPAPAPAPEQTVALTSDAPAPAPAPGAFASIDDVTANLNKNKAAANILAAFTKDGGTVVSGTSATGGHIQFPAKPGDPYKIVIDPANTKDLSDATGMLLFELLRWQNQADQSALIAQLKKGTITPEQYTDKTEELTYNYVKKQQEIAQAAVTAGDWKLTTDRFQALLSTYKTYEDFLKHEKDSGHYDLVLKNAKMIAGK